MKLFKLLSLAVIAAFLTTSCKDDDEKIVYTPTDIENTGSYGLNGKVKSVAYSNFEAYWDYEDKKVVKGDESSKSTDYFNQNGLWCGEDYYTYYDGRFRLQYEDRYEYDNRYRVTLYTEKYYYLGTNSSNFYENKVVYGNNNATITYTTTHTEDGEVTDKESVVRVCDLLPNGNIDAANYITYEKIEIDGELRNLADQDTSGDRLISERSERVVLATDSQNNWTKSYVKYQEFNEDGESIYTNVKDYTERTIAYY